MRSLRAEQILLVLTGEDMDIKDLIFEIVDKNTLISSPAGAGKTRILTELFLEYLKKGVSVNEIVATTYTNKAAGEIKERIITSFFRGDREKQELLKEYFSGTKRIRAFTIHSFLNDLLQVVIPSFSISGKRLPVELSENMFRSLAISCIRECYDRLARIKQVAVAGDSTSEISGLAFDIATDKDICDLLCSLYGKSPLSFFWAQRIKNISFKEAIAHFKSEELVRAYRDIAYLFEDAFYRFLAWKLERGYFEFHDIEFFAYLMVSIENSDESNFVDADWRDLLLYFNENFKVVLIDEFQDTSRLQWEIIRFLTDERFAGIGLSETTRSFVCLIGDPKQSIYSFRNADVSVMQQADAEFSYLESREPELYRKVNVIVNRRSKKPVVDFVNSIFSRLMKVDEETSPIWVTRYESFTSERGAGQSQVAAVFHEGNELNSREKAVWEAKFIANEIKRLVEEGVVIEDREGITRKINYSDIAILVKVKTHLNEYERELTKAGIPFIAVDGRFDTNRAFQFLKSFFIACGKPFENGYFIKMMGTLGYEYPDRNGHGIAALSKAEDSVLKIIHHAFSKYYHSFKEGPFEAYRVSIDALSPLFKLLSEEINISLALRVLSEMFSLAEEEGICTPFEMSEFIEEILSEGRLEIHSERDAVFLMSIHKSKGLEFSVVFAASLWGRGRGDSNLLMYPGSDDALCEIAFKFPDRGRKNLKNKEHIPASLIEMDDYFEERKLEFKRFNNEEIKRLFYVAFTRARDYLYVLLPSIKSRPNSENKTVYEELYEAIEELDIPELQKISYNPSFEAEVKSEENKEKCREEFFISKSVDLRKIYQIPFEIPDDDLELPLAKKVQPLSKKKLKKAYDLSAGFEVGTIFHEILFEFKIGLLSEDDIERRAKELCHYYYADEEQASEAALLAKSFLGTSEGKKLVKSGGKPEFAILSLEKGGYRIMRIDLLYEEDDKICVIEYKTHAEVSDLYRDQIIGYINGTRKLYPYREVVGKVIFVRTGEIVPILSEESGR